MKYIEILIVDDSSTSRMIIQRCFEIAGCSGANFIFAENGMEALSLLQNNNSIDLIITDLNMPEMDGENFINKLHSAYSGSIIPIIVVSSNGDNALKLKLLKAGVKAIIRKPINPAEIVKIMEELNE